MDLYGVAFIALFGTLLALLVLWLLIVMARSRW